MIAVSAQALVSATGSAFGVAEADMLGGRRHRPIVRARFGAIWLLRRVGKPGSGVQRTYSEVSRVMGGGDHSTMIHAIRKAEIYRSADPTYAATLDALADGLPLPVAPPEPADTAEMAVDRAKLRRADVLARRKVRRGNDLIDDDRDAIKRLNGTLALGDALQRALAERG